MLLLLISTIFTISSATDSRFPCCVVHETAHLCALEEGQGGCTFLDAEDPIVTSGLSGDAQCVSVNWLAFAQCEIDPNCTPTPKPPPPPVPPSSNCIMHACTATDTEYNIAFVIDESGSVGKTNYLTSLDFIENMLRTDIQPNANISMLAFASGIDRIYYFKQSQDDQRAGALAALTAERANYNSGGTCTATALREIAAEFKNTEFTTPEDDNMLFLMTDGYPNCGGDVCDEKPALNAQGIKVYIVGVGSGFNPSKVRCLVDEEKDILYVRQFDPRYFYNIESKLRNVVCPAVFMEETNLFIDIHNMISNDNGNVTFWCMIIAFIVFGIGWCFKHKLCEKNGKYQMIYDSLDTNYGSVQTV